MREPTWDETKDVFFSYLRPNETILWFGQPLLGVRLWPPDYYVIPLSALVVAYAVFWIGTYPWGAEQWLDYVVCVPLAILAIYASVGRFFGDAFIRRRIYYAVTNDRVLMLRRWPRESLESLYISTLPELKLEEEEDGSGTVFFG